MMCKIRASHNDHVYYPTVTAGGHPSHKILTLNAGALLAEDPLKFKQILSSLKNQVLS